VEWRIILLQVSLHRDLRNDSIFLHLPRIINSSCWNFKIYMSHSYAKLLHVRHHRYPFVFRVAFYYSLIMQVFNATVSDM